MAVSMNVPWFMGITEETKLCNICGTETKHIGFEGDTFCIICNEQREADRKKNKEKEAYKAYKKELLAKTGVDPRFLDITREEVINYALGKAKQNLLLYGLVGTGKTTCAVYIALSYFKRGFYPIYAKSYDVVNAIDNYLDCHLLIMDEMHKAIRQYASPSENDRTQLYELIEHRRNKGLNTVFISNFDKDSLVPLLGDEIYDRISDKNKTTAVYFKGVSFRQIEMA